jgi:hypothetical protein
MTTGQLLALIIFVATAAVVYASWRAGKTPALIGLVAVFGFGSAALSLYKDAEQAQVQERESYKDRTVTR